MAEPSSAARASNGVRDRLALLFPIEISDVDALVLGVACHLKNEPLVDVCCSKRLAAVVRTNMTHLAITPEDAVDVLSDAAAAAATADVVAAATDPLFLERKLLLQRALSSTLLEPIGSSQWNRPGIHLASVVAFVSESPIELLTRLFGTIVRTDVRKIEDLHFQFQEHQIDTILLSTILEALLS